jgi:hypothetical protein
MVENWSEIEQKLFVSGWKAVKINQKPTKWNFSIEILN